MLGKAGIFIGEALFSNPDYPLHHLSFRDVTLGEDGLRRLLEGVNSNNHIQRLHLGILNDAGLALVGRTLPAN